MKGLHVFYLIRMILRSGGACFLKNRFLSAGNPGCGRLFRGNRANKKRFLRVSAATDGRKSPVPLCAALTADLNTNAGKPPPTFACAVDVFARRRLALIPLFGGSSEPARELSISCPGSILRFAPAFRPPKNHGGGRNGKSGRFNESGAFEVDALPRERD